jgi:RNA polymerase sigma factor (TIGR02999 family)
MNDDIDMGMPGGYAGRKSAAAAGVLVRERRPETREITQILQAWRRGEQEAFKQLMSLAYEELRRIAHRQLRCGKPPLTLDTTGLVHEAYMKLVGGPAMNCRDRAHFFAISARAMRQIIVDYARKRSALKRGRYSPHVPLDRARLPADRQAALILALDEALGALAAIEERLVRVVECRFFAGYTDEETARALAISPRTVQRDWKRARAWLKEEMGSPRRPGTMNH